MINKKIFGVMVAVTLFCVPVLSNAQQSFGTNNTGGQGFSFDVGVNANTNSQISSDTCSAPKTIPQLFEYGRCVLEKGVITFLIGLALVLFLVGIVQYVASGDNEEKKEAGRSMMIFGIIALFVMVSVWGFVNILSRSFFGKEATLPVLPPAGKI